MRSWSGRLIDLVSSEKHELIEIEYELDIEVKRKEGKGGVVFDQNNKYSID